MIVGPDQVAGIPAIRQDGARRVDAGLELAGDVIDQVLNALVVVGPARSENIPADAPAVELNLEQPARRNEKTGMGNGFGQLELPAQEGARLTGCLAFQRPVDTLSRPVCS